MYWPYFALTRLFARWYIDSDFDLARVFVPTWHGCLADTSDTCRRGFSERIQVGVFLTGFAKIKAWRNVSDVGVVELDKDGIETTKD